MAVELSESNQPQTAMVPVIYAHGKNGLPESTKNSPKKQQEIANPREEKRFYARKETQAEGKHSETEQR